MMIYLDIETRKNYPEIEYTKVDTWVGVSVLPRAFVLVGIEEEGEISPRPMTVADLDELIEALQAARKEMLGDSE